MSVIRYINNTNKDIKAGKYTVPAMDQIILNETYVKLDELVDNVSLVCLMDGEQLGVEAPVVPEPEDLVIVTEPVTTTTTAEPIVTTTEPTKPVIIQP